MPNGKSYLEKIRARFRDSMSVSEDRTAPDVPVVIHEYDVIEDRSVMQDRRHYTRLGRPGILETSDVAASSEMALAAEMGGDAVDARLTRGLRTLARLRLNDEIEDTIRDRNPMIGERELAQAARAIWEADCDTYDRIAADGRIEVKELARAVVDLDLSPKRILAASPNGIPVIRKEHKREQ